MIIFVILNTVSYIYVCIRANIDTYNVDSGIC